MVEIITKSFVCFRFKQRDILRSYLAKYLEGFSYCFSSGLGSISVCFTVLQVLLHFGIWCSCIHVDLWQPCHQTAKMAYSGFVRKTFCLLHSRFWTWQCKWVDVDRACVSPFEVYAFGNLHSHHSSDQGHSGYKQNKKLWTQAVVQQVCASRCWALWCWLNGSAWKLYFFAWCLGWMSLETHWRSYYLYQYSWTCLSCLFL